MIQKKSFSYIVIIVFTIFLLANCSNNNKENIILQEAQLDIQPDQTGYNIEVAFVDSSHTKAILKAAKSRIYQERLETFLDNNIKVEFFSRYNQNRVSLLTADSAKIDDRTKNMIAWGKVFVVGDSSRTTIETSLLMWDNKNQKLYSTEFVTITSPNERIQGYGFESDQNLTNYKIFKVSGVQR